MSREPAQRKPTSRLDPLMRPTSIAIVGASTQRATGGTAALRNLLQEKYSGQLAVVHPTASDIDGVDAVASVDDLGFTPDTALVCLPASKVLVALQDLARFGCRSAVVPTAGFSPREGAELKAFMEQTPMVVHGPNNMGYINLTERTPIWIQRHSVTEMEAGPVAMVGQSGSACIYIGRTLGRPAISKMVSSGNEWQITAADYVRWLADDEATRAIALVIESIRDADDFLDAISVAREADKPVAVLRVGRTEAGRQATRAHTGAVVASDAHYDALFRDADVATTRDYDELAAMIESYAAPALSRPRGTRIAAMAMSGGQCALAADLIADRGLELAVLGDRTRERLEAVLPGGSGNNPVDTYESPLVKDPDAAYVATAGILLDDPDVDALMLVADAQPNLTDPELEVERPVADAVLAHAQGTSKPIIVASSSSVTIHPKFVEMAGDAVPLLRGIPNALAALEGLARNRKPVRNPRAASGQRRVPSEFVTALRAEIEAAEVGELSRELTDRIIETYGLPMPGSQIVRSEDEVAQALEKVAFPVVVKVSSRDIAHRADVGGVVVGLASLEEVQEAVTSIRRNVADARPDAVIEGFEIQHMVGQSLEVLVGYLYSPELGPLVVVGSGGSLVELYEDSAALRAPVTADEVCEALSTTRIGRLLAGYRGLHAPTDLAPVADFVCRVSEMAADLGDLIPEMDANPVLVETGGGRATAVDILLSRRDAGGE